MIGDWLYRLRHGDIARADGILRMELPNLYDDPSFTYGSNSFANVKSRRPT
jgi:hypothetical protein